MLSPVVDQVAEEIEGVSFGKVNVDENPSLASEFSVYSIPTLVILKDGKIEALNLDFVMRIREYPRKKNGKKKSVVLD
jgi:thioredoxin 1